ncbi:MAG: hypothetical protein CM1200mP36_10600 [Gammaproteobacteria bacterium]|nr:MAG: hypothetical protein CM1200mP36_10600 [Gammaproteobacteria bacterium]
MAAYLVQGRGVKDFPALRAFAAAQPQALNALLAKLSDAMATYLINQARAGADAVQIFDSWAGILSLRDWERLIRPHLETMLKKVGEADVPRILFLQNAPHLMEAYASLPAEVLSVDWRVDIADVQGPPTLIAPCRATSTRRYCSTAPHSRKRRRQICSGVSIRRGIS